MLDIERTSWYNHQVFLVASSHRANHSQCTARWPYQCASGRPTQCQSTWWGLKLNRFKSRLEYFQNKSRHFWQNQNLKSSFRNAFPCKDTVLSIRSLLLFWNMFKFSWNSQIASRLRARAMSTILTITVLMPLPLPSTLMNF